MRRYFCLQLCFIWLCSQIYEESDSLETQPYRATKQKTEPWLKSDFNSSIEYWTCRGFALKAHLDYCHAKFNRTLRLSST